jgi:hypothetical protein
MDRSAWRSRQSHAPYGGERTGGRGCNVEQHRGASPARWSRRVFGTRPGSLIVRGNRIVPIRTQHHDTCMKVSRAALARAHARGPGNTYGTIGFAGTQTNWTQVLSERPGIPATGSLA